MTLVGKNSEKNNQNLMQLIRRAHGLVENPDLEKHRQSQDHIGELLGNSKELQYRPVDIDGMDAEWVSVNRAHMKKYVILHCHGGGYSTGSSIYARTLTSKLAAGTSMDVLCFDYRLAPEHPYPAAAEDIYDTFGVSKKTFKKGVGDLYKKRLITLHEDGIALVES